MEACRLCGGESDLDKEIILHKDDPFRVCICCARRFIAYVPRLLPPEVVHNLEPTEPFRGRGAQRM